MPGLASATLVTLLSTMPPAAAPPAALEHARPVLGAVHHPPALARSARGSQNGSRSKDSLRNGAIIGAITGGLAGMYLGAGGCAGGSLMSMTGDEADCTGPVLLGGMLVGLIGAGIGASIDAMFEKGPSVAGVPQGQRRGVRLHFRW